MNYERLIQEVIDEHKVSPIDIMRTGDATNEYTYLNAHIDSYIKTVRDVDCLLADDKGRGSILEIGSFLGPVSISLKRIGYSVCALDVPEFHRSSSLRSLFEKNGIRFDGLDLRQPQLPYESNSFNAVIICEVIEHLNFNPLPVLKEINRVLRPGGYIYVGMPNQSTVVNRLKLLLGKSIRDSIDHFSRQLDSNDNMIIWLHWREYTLSETIRLIETMGFETIKKYYFVERVQWRSSVLKKMLKAVLYAYPSFRPNHVVIGRKGSAPVGEVWKKAANY